MGIKERSGNREKLRKKIRRFVADLVMSVGRVKPDKKCKVGCKSRPHKIGDLQISSSFVNPVKFNNHKHYKD